MRNKKEKLDLDVTEEFSWYLHVKFHHNLKTKKGQGFSPCTYKKCPLRGRTVTKNPRYVGK